MAYLRARVLTDLSRLDEHLATHEFLAGRTVTMADISCCAYLFWLRDIDIERPSYPHLHRWLTTLSELPRWMHPDQALKPGTA